MHRQCLNCGHIVKENFCSHCGQNTHTGRITWGSFVSEFLHTLTHAERSILGTTWQLFKHPGKVLDEYIGGKRKKYQAPAGFFLIWVTLSILIHKAVIAQNGFNPVYQKGITFSDAESIKAFITHGELFYILTFPLSAFLFYFILGKPTYSYMESLVVTVYGFSMTDMFYVLCYLIGGVLFSLNVLHWKFYLFQVVLSVLYTVWVCISLLRKKKIKFLGLRIFLFIVINAVVVLKFLEWISGGWVQLEKYFSH